MTKDNCDCQKDCSCGEHGKVHLRCLIDPLYNTLPDNLKEMIHSLDQQTLAVLAEMKKWAQQNGHHEIAQACDHKTEKIHNHMTAQS